MKKLFIEAKYYGKPRLGNIGNLPENIGLVTTIQFVDYLGDIRDFLAKRDIKCLIGKGNQANAGQLLGCDVSAAVKVKDKVEAFLYVGDGRFHPVKVAIDTKKDVFIFNPMNDDFSKLDKKEVIDHIKKKKGARLKFLSSKNIGIVVSIKKGQHRKAPLGILRKKYPDKQFYVFMADTVDFNQLQNFNFIEAWINTACPRMDEDLAAVSIDELL